MTERLPRKSRVLLVLSASLFLAALFPAHLAASSLTLAWDPNTEPDLAGYKVYCGTRSRHYDSAIDVGKNTYCKVSYLAPKTRYYFTLTAYDTSRNESDFSWEVSAVTGDEPDPAPSGGSTLPLTASEGGSGGCFIATAAYGSYLDPHVKTLRGFRDELLIPSSLGRRLVNLYYRYSPLMASCVGRSRPLRFLTRQALLPLAGMSSLFVRPAASRRLAPTNPLSTHQIQEIRDDEMGK
jgi:hypothetical protein